MGHLPDLPCHACRERALPGKDHCANHPPKAQVQNAAEKTYDRNRGRTADRKFYNTAAWAETTRLVKQYNPQCQRILEDGRQCQRPPEVTHHLQDPKDAPALKLAWQNLVAVCTEHHSGGERGETQGAVYCHTMGPLSACYKHIPDGGYPQWNKLFKRAAPAEAAAPGLPQPCGGRTSCLGDTALDAALAAED